MGEKKITPSLYKAEPPDVASVPSVAISPQHRKPYDTTISFEEYHYYALKAREEERHLPPPRTNWARMLVKRKSNKLDANSGVDAPGRAQVTDEEWTNANRMMRTASSGACGFTLSCS